ncbi:hypothetical protein K431DRAFT_116584 [Polychaeton citri CBS 116435]|uniref:Uncharacterized protein n=1 Tax=Polychaeton citri CBS 116435 TaxID=1314669 RepID=A0A9P4QEK5_9PEZI|nr:hypothetical protein K431DRAFT_116584 [Polychaeton citri CBS 116435]
MNFAPYQSEDPESERAKSPPLRSPTGSPRPQPQRPQRNISAVAASEDPWAAARAQQLPSPSQYTDLEGGPGPANANSHGYTYTGDADIFETSLGFPLKIEACLAYLLLPPAGGVVLLIFEQKSDYVRFHAWQSALLFSAMFLIHIIFSWTTVFSWILFAIDIGLIAWLTWGAFKNADTLDRVEVPIFGRLASGFVDDE